MGESLSFGGLEETLLPNGVRTFSVAWPRVLGPGKYRAMVSVDFADRSQPVTRTVKFTAK